MERIESVSRNALRELHVGQTRIFNLTTPNKVASARITCLQLKKEFGLEFEVKTDYITSAVCITRKK